MFRRSKDEKAEAVPELASNSSLQQTIGISSASLNAAAQTASQQLSPKLAGWTTAVTPAENIDAALHSGLRIVLSVFEEPATLSRLMDAVLSARSQRSDGYPILIIAQRLEQLCNLGTWLYSQASQDKLSGIRLIVAEDLSGVLDHLSDKLEPVLEPNVIKMPASTEVDCKDFKYFFAITPELRQLSRTIRQLAENNVNRIYLLGGPGTGKTSIAYYYYLCRKRGNFVSVNLTAESTGDKESMKSLLCGHVSGSISGAGAREGALSFAGDGVAFLDESHGVTGVVMQVLMEVLDSGQFLPFGATKKRALECAVVFASNRSWEALRNMMNLDEHARLGATILQITDLASRQEDMIAVLATTLAKFSRQCVTWTPPAGLSTGAWQIYKNCRWHGNTRTLIRVTEAACIAHSLGQPSSRLIETKPVQEAIELWEPSEHHSLEVYTSFRSVNGDNST